MEHEGNSTGTVVGICGVGFVGTAISAFFKDKLQVIQYDKYNGINTPDELLCTDILYICLPTQWGLKTYDTKELCYTLKYLNDHKYSGAIMIKSTVIPPFVQQMNNNYPSLLLIANPEFLSAATAATDFANQRQVVLGFTDQSQCIRRSIVDFHKNYFPGAEISECTSYDASLMKLGCNAFYATKIQYFTELKFLCDKIGADFTSVKSMMLKNDWINPMHTQVPGHDGQVSFGGACLPKDTKALFYYMNLVKSPNAVIEAVSQERDAMRNNML
jgi:UDP-glucose 6-dehydrogenase